MYQIPLLLILVAGILAFNRWMFSMRRKRRRDYYRNEYLRSDAWQRKRYVVLKRELAMCVLWCTCNGSPSYAIREKEYRKGANRMACLSVPGVS